MITILDILIKEKDMDKLGLIEQKVHWGNEEYSRDPQKYLYNSDLELSRIIDMQYYKSYIDEWYNINKFISLTVNYERLRELEVIINSVDNSNHIIIDLISRMCELLDEFCVLLIRDEEYIDDKYCIEDIDEVKDILIKSFDRCSERGLLIIR